MLTFQLKYAHLSFALQRSLQSSQFEKVLVLKMLSLFGNFPSSHFFSIVVVVVVVDVVVVVVVEVLVEIMFVFVKDGVKVVLVEVVVEVVVVVVEVVVEVVQFFSPDRKSALEVQSILIEEHSSLFCP